MKHLILVILLALAPLSWGEDVWYCVVAESHWIGTSPDDEPTTLANDEKLDTLTVKYDAGAGEILVQSKLYGMRDGTPFRFVCTNCEYVEGSPELHGLMRIETSETSQLETFALLGRNFYQSGYTYKQVYAEAGTCTKF